MHNKKLTVAVTVDKISGQAKINDIFAGYFW
jgi:hypothetical protein